MADPKQQFISISGARVNNLKNVSCKIPKDVLTVITGPSGSGKSSLAFDTLFAEGQRRYIESMSSYARQFFARIEKPDVDHIEHILPSVALEQKNSIKNARSTVGTNTEVYDYLRILFATIGTTHCPDCGDVVSRIHPQQIKDHITQYKDGTKLLLTAPVSLNQISTKSLVQQGFYRIYHDEKMVDITQAKADEIPKHGVVQVIVDRFIVGKGAVNTRLIESISNAVTLSGGKLTIIDLANNTATPFVSDFSCPSCHRTFEEPTANMFSFNSPLGACPTCEGYGRIIGLDLDKVIPNKTLSVAEGAIHPFTMPSNQEIFEDLLKEAKAKKIPVNKPYKDLTRPQKEFLMNGHGDYPGIRRFFDWLETKKYKVHVRVMLAKYRGYYPCPDCFGSRIKPSALFVTINKQHIHALTEMTIQQLSRFFDALKLSERDAKLSERILKEVNNRLSYLNNIGLGYLTLSRQSRTLSNGEAQRINLSATLGASLTDTLYVLDEPTVGLHARDTDRLIQVLQTLRNNGNTLVVVEHDPDMIVQADHLIDMGPGGGEEGGRIIYEGGANEITDVSFSLTGQYLANPPKLSVIDSTHKNGKKKPQHISVVGAKGNNLKNITLTVPKNKLVCITGVSGSGKSTLIQQTLYTAYEHSKGQSLQLDVAPHQRIEGLDDFKDIIMVDQSPPGRSARSNPITYVKAYDAIRKLFADSRKAMVLGITPSHFSFNSPGGRCETCEGLGTLTVDMQFMADVTVVCPDCQGKRFNHNVLSIEVNGKSIFDVLNLTVDEAMDFFKNMSTITKKLYPLQQIGLGYLKLGQSTATLSGGEAQRLKLASYLKSSGKETERYLFLFDEPTTGLHMADITLLVSALRQILQAGHSVVVIEHNIDFIAQTDHVVDLGPDGGDGGGEIIAQGSVTDIINTKNSYTGKYLAERLNRKPSKKPPAKKATKKRKPKANV